MNVMKHGLSGLGGFTISEGVSDWLTRRTGRPSATNVALGIVSGVVAAKNDGVTGSVAIGAFINSMARLARRHLLPWLDLGQSEATIAAARAAAQRTVDAETVTAYPAPNPTTDSIFFFRGA